MYGSCSTLMNRGLFPGSKHRPSFLWWVTVRVPMGWEMDVHRKLLSGLVQVGAMHAHKKPEVFHRACSIHSRDSAGWCIGALAYLGIGLTCYLAKNVPSLRSRSKGSPNRFEPLLAKSTSGWLSL